MDLRTTHKSGTVLAVCGVGMDEQGVCGVERAMLLLRWSVKRRALERHACTSADACLDVSHVLVVEAVEGGLDLASDDATDDEVTVGVVATRLGVDPSHASRLVTAAIKAGLVVRVPSQEDGRRSRLELTEPGRALAEHGRRFRRGLFAQAMGDWSRSERQDFARLLMRFVTGLVQAHQEPPATRRTAGS